MANTKEHIIEVAARLIHLRGFNHTSIGEILKESGVGKGNFYYYFRSKEELGYAIVKDNFRRFSEEVTGKAFGNNRDAVTQLDDFLDILLEIHRRRNCAGGCRLGNMAMELSDIHEEFRKKFQDVFDGWSVQVEGVLQKAKAGGQLTGHADLQALAQFVIASVEGAILLAKVKKDISTLERCLKELKKYVRMYVNRRLPLPA
ncbi:MAG: TetR family transcriptional regulator C-terminal domain-containing protein [candidate division NC10 bacterium]|nr:TetR family transcriptional regulator C-terminal domain-containing protein [candidate division NC10 bacterium]MDE2320839.1 TetR family transcriptional regulator C-terminal domain-containing protein [candidate division NC10 bacterium]